MQQLHRACPVPADVQKLAKQAIFSAHRGDEPQCSKRLKEAEGIAHELLPLIQELPDLRYGSFSNSMEEVQLMHACMPA